MRWRGRWRRRHRKHTHDICSNGDGASRRRNFASERDGCRWSHGEFRSDAHVRLCSRRRQRLRWITRGRQLHDRRSLRRLRDHRQLRGAGFPRRRHRKFPGRPRHRQQWCRQDQCRRRRPFHVHERHQRRRAVLGTRRATAGRTSLPRHERRRSHQRNECGRQRAMRQPHRLDIVADVADWRRQRRPVSAVPLLSSARFRPAAISDQGW